MSADTRIEHDSSGAIAVPAARLWGAQTQRALQHFEISIERWAPETLQALARVKRAAALASGELGALSPELADALARAAAEVIDGRHPDEFPLPVWQSGSGTQTNMNMNEVLANRASELLGGPRGAGRRVHPNDHANLGQSSNDAIPTAMHVALADALAHRVVPALHELAVALRSREHAFAGLLKIGRTHLQDAVPMTLGQAFGGYASQVERARRGLVHALDDLLPLPIGGTAIGTGLNAPPGFAQAVTRRLADDCGLDFEPASDRFALIGAHDPIVAAHGALAAAAVALLRIGNDLRLLSSGPDAGLGEIRLPANEPGSSTMPGKVNPTQIEALTMACVQVIGNQTTVAFAGAGGQLELNVYKPLLAHLSAQGARLIADSVRSFTRHCVRGIEADAARLAEHVSHSRMLVTALAPHVGYDAAARIAQRAARERSTLRAAAGAEGVAGHDYDRWVDPAAMAGLAAALSTTAVASSSTAAVASSSTVAVASSSTAAVAAAAGPGTRPAPSVDAAHPAPLDTRTSR